MAAPSASHHPTPVRRQGDRTALTIVFVASALLFLALIRSLLIALLLGGMCAIIGYPSYRGMVRSLRGHRHLAALIMSFVFTVLFLAPVAGLVVATFDTATDVAADLATRARQGEFDTATLLKEHPGVAQAFRTLNRLTGRNDTPGQLIREALQSAGTSVTAIAGVILSGATQFSLVAVLVVVSLYYFFLDGERLVMRLRQLSPLKNVQDRELLREFQQTIYGLVLGVFVAAILQGTLCGITYWAVGVPHAPLLSGLTVLAAFLPLGSAVVWLPLGLVSIVAGSVRTGLLVLVLCTGIVTVVDNVIRPLLIKGRVRMHPLLVFIGLFGGFEVFGLFGVFIGPLIVSVFLTLLRFVEEDVIRPEAA